ncbi:signal peptidase II [Parasporobacterium paucivorans]|uniref:Lipoprotein signal peptidase n=1 Tax=Parasporobacterium paucivorans DSM 15970 TaxID=1122934 RepID=A0A1M6A3M8_9FIRM|nr:signal peptidase II [Parasporobacterium paucivorans]SHI31124.1 signal peptidase II [Parasporobacterium paucivorans DSM 15970]
MNMKPQYRSVLNIAIFVFLVFADQLTKYFVRVYLMPKGSIPIISGVLELRYLENFGAAFGILQNKKVFFVIITLIIMIIIFYVSRKIYSEIYCKKTESAILKKFIVLDIVLLVLAAGALGNLVDRIRFNYVVDFIYFKLIDFPIFNIADCCVTLSAITLIIIFLFVIKDNDFKHLFPSKKAGRLDK